MGMAVAPLEAVGLIGMIMQIFRGLSGRFWAILIKFDRAEDS